jgi:hypothetical protein
MSTARFALTVFPDVRAQTARAASMTLEEMAWHARITTAPEKARLPLWKLATFGNGRTKQGSLRSDSNVIGVTGVEGDYDGEAVHIDEVVEKAEKIGLRALIYTSPSHTPRKPRWRIMCPASRVLAKEQRRILMGRLNGAYAGIFSRESWTLSQTYFFGSVGGSPNHRVEVVEGMPIDRLDELDEIWIGPAAGTASNGGGEAASGSAAEETDAELVRCIVTGEGFHVELCALAARYIGRGIDGKTVAEILRGLMLAHPEAARDARWRDRYQSIGGLVKSALEKYGSGAEGRRAIASTTHRMVRLRAPADEIHAAVLREAEQRGMAVEAALGIAGAILREKVEGRRHA